MNRLKTYKIYKINNILRFINYIKNYQNFFCKLFVKEETTFPSFNSFL